MNPKDWRACFQVQLEYNPTNMLFDVLTGAWLNPDHKGVKHKAGDLSIDRAHEGISISEKLILSYEFINGES